MSILSNFTIEQIKKAGGNCMSIATAEYYYELYMQYQIRKQKRTKMEAYRVTSEECFISEDVVMRAVKFAEGLTVHVEEQ